MYSMKGAGMALKPWVAFVLAGSLLLAGCGGGGGGSGGGTGGSSSGGASSSSSGGTSSSSSGGGSGTTGPMLSGVVHGGQSPLAGSTVTLYVAGAGGSATTVASARTDGSGAFSIAADCTAAPLTPTALVYVTARGGDAGAGDNGAIALESALGQCRSLPASVNIDEVSTVASAYALSAFHGTSGISGKSPGLDNAFATVASLVNVAAGGAAATLPDAAACAAKPAPANCLAIERLDTLANALAACVASPAANSAQCTQLFNCAVAGASYSSGTASCTPPVDAVPAANTLDAALKVARAPGMVAVAGIYAVATADAAFSPALPAAPTDWTLSLNYTGGGLGEPTQAAIDAAGNVWLANYNNAVTKLSPVGAALSPATGYIGGGLEESFGIAIDAAGNVWVVNEQSASRVNAGRGSVTELSPAGAVLSGSNGYSGGGVYFPEAVAVDAAGNVWVADYGDSALTKLQGSGGSSPGAALSPSGGYTGGGLSFPQGIAIDGSGNIWLSDSGANQVSAFSPAGTALSPDTGYRGGGLDVPQALALDQDGRVWVANFYGDSVTELDASGTPVSGSPYSGAGFNAPGGIAIDGAGNVWVTNYRGASISELQGDTSSGAGTALSPASGFTGAGLSEPFSPAIDSAGNLWTGNFGNDSVTEFIGVAAPVKTPLIGLPSSP